MKKYTFAEFLAAKESISYAEPDSYYNFDNPDPSWLTHFKNDGLPDLKDEIHLGDCTKFPTACYLCGLEDDLRDYRKYYFNEEKWRKDNIIF